MKRTLKTSKCSEGIPHDPISNAHSHSAFVETSQKSLLKARMRVDINIDNISCLSKKRSVNVFPESSTQARGSVVVQTNLTSFIFDRAVDKHFSINLKITFSEPKSC
jgi:hypothetical protein